MDVATEDLFEHSIGTLSLTIRLRMVRGRHVDPCSEKAEHGAPKLRREPWVSVRDQVTRQPVESKHGVDEHASTATRWTIFADQNTIILVVIVG